MSIQRALQIRGDLCSRLSLVGAIPPAIGFGLVDLGLSTRAYPALGHQFLDELGVLFGPDG
ncbi:hypothetical protein [Arthrobacter sp. MYb214]|uniref:hypothetical protein n=1 Tax=Arthrobacter sp. MYb214 TaxID=1848596 RepID=UPI0025710091|nr:hypothetical protein [Arthrobacter sp. MYb214]